MQGCVLAVMFLLFAGFPLGGQTRANDVARVVTDSVGSSSLPVIVKFSGGVEEFGGTFALYRDQTGGSSTLDGNADCLSR